MLSNSFEEDRDELLIPVSDNSAGPYLGDLTFTIGGTLMIFTAEGWVEVHKV